MNKKYRTFDGYIATIFSSQKASSKTRGHVLPSYTKEELSIWIKSQPDFEDLWNGWIESDYNRWAKPSVDRIKDNLPYAFSNMQLMTWQENSDKPHLGGRKAIEQIKDGQVIAIFKSNKEANELTGILKACISAACNGVQKTAGGYEWRIIKTITTSLRKN